MPKSAILRLMLNLVRLGLALFFLYTSVAKIPDLPTTALFLTRSDIFPESASMPLACIGVAMEFVVGCCFLFRCYYFAASIWSLVMCSTFVALFVQAWFRGLDLSCNCTGTSAIIDNYPMEVGYRLLLAGACLITLWDAFRLASLAKKGKPLDFSEA
ncbi:MAG: hypothetical protein R3Y56_04385 [Akkermansia sp.]